ncbi:M20/M25/M40 family metallo-hydrolase [Caulobacter sp. BE254]|uniref:M20/M25/M40 family metallo-hydrolase n=1 Tax=Caulobacter sp. BE254 TaxID=2817720 RepID=UPI002861EEB0|nr:M20/M25/M40 family metallo-hydrolase [Caulobacter sp. BE254]MDR7115723.1 Zn-dependent M28 family amino/carboxypeptidase [Caulobacter sp. BE254]
MPFSRRAALAGVALLLAVQPVLAAPAAKAKPAAAKAAGFTPSADAIKAHMGFLADDLLEGREAGTRGYDIAAKYVASQYALMHVKPAGDDGSYLQQVPLTAYRAANEGGVSYTGAGGKSGALVFGEDYLPSAQARQAETRITAPLVFVGYGIVAPERGRDDYAGLDVKGKIVVVLNGAPSGLQTEIRAHYSNTNVKRAEAARRGAVGVLTLPTTSYEKRRPFARNVGSYQEWKMTWNDAQGAAYVRGAEAPGLASLSLKGGAKLFAGAPTSLDEVLVAAEAPDGVVKGFALPSNVTVQLKTEIEKRQSSNVVGLIEGSDPTLKAQTVILSAHLDHLGIHGKDADKINNGALDNASGVATLLEVARGFKEARTKPRRSIVLLVVTAEEKGLIGSEYFAHNPTVPMAGIAADVNLDMPILLYDFQDVVAFGADRSSIGPAVARAAGRVGIGLSPDPLPEEGLFTRSDHYRFVEQGVPSVFLMTGFKNGGEKGFKDFLATHYHKPNDDLNQPIDYQAGARFALVNYEIARELADAPARPSWNKGDFFGTLFGKK